MITIKKELGFDEFVEIYEELAKDRYVAECTREGLVMIYEELEALTADRDVLMDLVDIKDFLRFTIEVMSESEVIHYFAPDTTDTDDIIEIIENDTYLIGTYKKDDETYYIFYAC